MGTPPDGENGSGSAGDGKGVLANLPRTRPQRSTPRRTAARNAATTSAAAETAPRPVAAGTRTQGAGAARPRKAKSTRATATKPRAAAATRRPARPRTAAEPVPRQGFASEGERVSGPVQPPGGAEFLATAAEIVSELTKAGVSAGERLVKDAFSRLPLS